MAWFRKKDRPAGPEDWSGYRQRYGQECRRIWQRLVPPEGQAATVQGELLREIEKLYHEAWGNGNINWDGDFAWFCGNLRDTLLGAGCFQQEERQAIAQVLEKIEACGRYAQAWYEGGVPEESWEPEKMAWLEEGAYSFLRDMAARFSLAQPEPIPFQPERELYR